ncbi:hypothetical protein H0H87_011283 [Tephrocybe sp. NHM501043]|nr:hypothetical protein H0H87_011283 [Tephrocybe sp. NHM501043]
MDQIPLGPDWTYGGLTSPASTSTIISVTTTDISTSTTDIPITTTNATPTSLPPSITSTTPTATPSPTTTSPSSISLSSSFTTTLPSASSTPTSVGAGSHLARGQLIGIIVASILGFIFLFIAAILIYLCMKGRKERNPDFETIYPEDQTQTLPTLSRSQPGPHTEHGDWKERSPRMSGGEADPFLAQTTPDSPTNSISHEMTQHTNLPPPVGIARVPVPTTGSQSSKGSSGTGKSSATNHSGYGVIMEHPTLNLLPSTAEELERQRRGHILSPEELTRMNEEAVIPVDGHYPGLSTPSRLLDNPRPDEGWTSHRDPPSHNRLPLTAKDSQNSLAAYPDAHEPVTVLTARRVRVEELGSRSPRLTDSLGEGSSKNGSRGFLSSLGLNRLSWFKSLDSGSRRNSRANSYITSPRNDEDVEMGKALLDPEMAELQPPVRGLGLFDGERPLSTASARSAATVYHDAYSTPGTPVSARIPIAPLPRALTPSGSGLQQQSGWPSSSTIPPVPDLPNPSHSYSTSITNVNYGLPDGEDILDAPAPTAVIPFALSTQTSVSSLRDTATDVTQGFEANPFPPGLSVAPQKLWIDEGSSTITHVTSPITVPAPMNVNPILSVQDTAADISIDILEEAPPSAREGWRSLAAEQGFLGAGRRTTFGIPIAPSDAMSDGISLYSARSHLSPSYTRSTGSDPVSTRRDLSGSLSSASSRPSAFSATQTHSSGQSLAHSGSISSDARMRTSPAMSAFGPRTRSPQPPLPNAPPIAHYPPERAGTHRLMGSQDMDGQRSGMSSPEPMSPLSQLSSAPWAGGLGDSWAPTA